MKTYEVELQRTSYITVTMTGRRPVVNLLT